jgi:hypothetical protein
VSIKSISLTLSDGFVGGGPSDWLSSGEGWWRDDLVPLLLEEGVLFDLLTTSSLLGLLFILSLGHYISVSFDLYYFVSLAYESQIYNKDTGI